MLKHLSLTNFRNYVRLEVDFPKGLLICVGENAQGKTNLLEAIYYLATFLSFQAESDRQLIHFLALHQPLAVARIVAEYQRGSFNHRLEVRLILEKENSNGIARIRKEVLLDGVKQKLTAAIGHFSAVIFLPDSIQIIEGPPEERRRFLNLAIGQVNPAYTEALVDFNRALQQRNALLKLLSERGGDESQLDFWDGEVSRWGGFLIHARIQALEELEAMAAPRHRQLTRGKEGLVVLYLPSYDPYAPAGLQGRFPIEVAVNRRRIPLQQIQEGYLQALRQHRHTDIQKGVTSIGPHRDEIRFLSNGLDLGSYGSRGQTRTAAIALKLAELDWIHTKTNHPPIFLLDEVLAELDPFRRLDLLNRLLECEQAILTTTELGLIDSNFLQRASIWKIQDGRVHAPAPQRN
ncbi:MAG: DNA replication/repair protein RecF [Anaerolineales bacterium]|nr:DNA replication/repair protein RecF [Anaerolineales bacterium]MDW8162612.1 DNA replication/repair protein RecF [Anaerolineales bacterium]